MLIHFTDGKIVRNCPLKELTLKDFCMVYGEDFIAENLDYVRDFLTGVNQRKKEFEEASDEQERSGIHVMTLTSFNPNNEKTIQ